MNLSSFIWSVADLLRGKYKPHEYGQVILPFTVLRRMDCVLEPTKQAVLKEAAKRDISGDSVNHYLTRASGNTFYNTSPMDLKAIVGDQDNVAMNLAAYLHGFSPNVKDIFARFKLEAQIDRLANADLLYLVTEKFSKIDLHPDRVSNADMGTIFEELIRKFAELSNETAGEHFTPREVIRLMVNLIFAEDARGVRQRAGKPPDTSAPCGEVPGSVRGEVLTSSAVVWVEGSRVRQAELPARMMVQRMNSWRLRFQSPMGPIGYDADLWASTGHPEGGFPKGPQFNFRRPWILESTT
jgi:hypothetical protein